MPYQDPYASPENRGGSQFADVSRYLTQNRDASNRLASKIGNQAVTAGNQARSDIAGVQNSFNQAANSSVIPYNQDVANRAATNPMSFFNYNYVTQTKGHGPKHPAQSQVVQGTTPTGVADQAALDQFNAMKNASYTGPTDLTGQQGYGTAVANAQKAANITGQLGTDIGRSDLLQGMYGGKTNVGASALDRLLLGGGDSMNILNQAAANNQGIGSAVTNANNAAVNSANAIAAANSDTAAKIAKQGQDAIAGVPSTAAFHGKKDQQKVYDSEKMLNALNQLYGVS